MRNGTRVPTTPAFRRECRVRIDLILTFFGALAYGRLLRVEVADQIVTDRVINELMGKDTSARFRFIMGRAAQAQELDV